MSAPRQLQDLISELAHDYPSAVLEFSPLPSGVCFLWTSLHGRDFVIEYDPKRGTGVSENFSDTPLGVGHDEAYDSLDEAITHFKNLMGSAVRHEAQLGSALAFHDKPIST